MNHRFFYMLALVLLSSFLLGQDSVMPLQALLVDTESSPLICGHRGGYYKDMPENSISIMDYIYTAQNGNTVMFEIDIRSDKDGVLWLMHDEELTRATNGKGNIATKSTKEIQKLSLKNQHGKLTKEKVPTFEDVLKYVGDKNIYLILDIKGNIFKEVLALAKKYQLDNRCIVLTFTDENTKNALSEDGKCIVSTLITTHEEYEKFKKLNHPKERISAYVTEKTPNSVLHLLKQEQILTLSDPREIWNNFTSPLSVDFYNSFVKKLQLNILVTDFPIEINKGLSYHKNTSQTIHSLHLKKFKWFAAQQFDSLTTLLHDDVHYIHSNGWKETKDEVINNIKSGKLTYTDVVVHESDVRLIGQTGVVTGKGTFYVGMDGTQYAFDLYYTEVYAITNEGIKLVSRHACKYDKK